MSTSKSDSGFEPSSLLNM